MSLRTGRLAADVRAALDSMARYYGWMRSAAGLAFSASAVIAIALLLPIAVTLVVAALVLLAVATFAWRIARSRNRLRRFTDRSYDETSTRQAIERHEIGPNGLPRHHRTQRTIVARVDGVDRYVVRFDYGSRVRALNGGDVVAHYSDGERDVYCAEIDLRRVLDVNNEHHLELDFGFPRRPKRWPPPRFRLGFNRSYASVTLCITFHQRAYPRRIWRSVWPDVESDPSDVERVTLDSEGSASWYLESEARGKLYGFRWEF